jgi:hypothetical protein
VPTVNPFDTVSLFFLLVGVKDAGHSKVGR